MLGTIVKKEILEHLKSAKFLIGLILTVILMTLSTSINIRDYIQRRQDHLESVKLHTNPQSRGRLNYIFRSPQPLSFLVQGKDRVLGFKLYLSQYDFPLFPTSDSSEFQQARRRFATGFQNVDFAFVVKIALGLMAIFLGYNSIAGEKSQGTLKASLANSIPKDTILLGKLLGGLFVIIGVFLAAVLATLLIIIFNPLLSLSGADWVRIIGLLGFSILYLGMYYALSLSVSVMVNRPASALIILLQIWVFLTVIYPCAAIRLVDRFRPIPEENDVVRLKNASTDDLYDELMRVSDENNRISPLDREARNKGWLKIWKIENEILSKRQAVNEEMSRSMSGQMKTAQAVSFLSPAVLFDIAIERLARTGISEYEKFLEGVKRFHGEQIEWIRDSILKDEGKVEQAPAFFASSETLGESCLGAIACGITLFIEMLILFAFAYVWFLKKDVR